MKNNQETATEYCERVYPEMMDEYKRIMWEQYETFCKKQRNYGPGNISVGTQLQTPDDIKLSLTGLWFRMNDKINRLKQMIIIGAQDNVGESLTDTYQDLSVYGIIAQIVQNKKFVAQYGGLDFSEGMSLVREPKGYEKENPAITYIKLKSWVATAPLSDTALQDKNLATQLTKAFEYLQPLISFLNEGINA